jgi:hypothetical protein
MLKVVHDVEASNEPAGGSLLDEIVRDGARQMLAAALQAQGRSSRRQNEPRSGGRKVA